MLLILPEIVLVSGAYRYLLNRRINSTLDPL
jgi:hypothetical protein